MMLVLLVPLKTTRTSIVPRLWALGFSMVAEVLQLILWTMAMSVYAACETVWLLVEMVDGWASYHVLTADARLLHARARLARAQRAKLLAEHGDFPQEARFVNALRGPLNSEATPTQRASGRLARATSALRALLEHKARIAEETRRQDAEEEARACARRLQRANAMVYGVGRCWVAWCHFLCKKCVYVHGNGIVFFGSRRSGARKKAFFVHTVCAARACCVSWPVFALCTHRSQGARGKPAWRAKVISGSFAFRKSRRERLKAYGLRAARL